jgi:hypothetical protein
MVLVQVDLTTEENKIIEHYKIDLGLNDKREAIKSMIRQQGTKRGTKQ